MIELERMSPDRYDALLGVAVESLRSRVTGDL